jgi:hypothetical protein
MGMVNTAQRGMEENTVGKSVVILPSTGTCFHTRSIDGGEWSTTRTGTFRPGMFSLLNTYSGTFLKCK